MTLPTLHLGPTVKFGPRSSLEVVVDVGSWLSLVPVGLGGGSLIKYAWNENTWDVNCELEHCMILAQPLVSIFSTFESMIPTL